MAIAHGTCGSWKSVLRLIGGDLPQCGSPEDLARAVKSLLADRPHWPEQVAAEVARLTGELLTRVPALEADVDATLRAARQYVAAEVAGVSESIRQLESTPFLLARWFNRWWRAPRLRSRLAQLRDEPLRAARPKIQELVEARGELQRLQADPRAEAIRRVNQRQARLDKLQAAIGTQEFAGAVAECRVAALLARGLPDEFHVFNDVLVEQDRWSFDGREHRRSAQIDHVVIGPGGVFVIETKLWSRAFAAGGDHYDPYRQVRWAGRLLHRRLAGTCGRNVRVREVIATRGSLPPKPADSYAKVLSPEEVCGYIRWFKPELAEPARAAIASVLNRTLQK